MNFIKKVEIFTDGACSGNPGPGGWGAILRYGKAEKELSGGEKNTTNNRMELMAFIKALEALNEPCTITAYSDSKYLCDAINQKWVFKWEKNNWRKSDKKSVLNIDLWKKLLSLLEKHSLELIWIKGHAGHKENERCDRLAVSAIRKLK